jgi:hypothetical protein
MAEVRFAETIDIAADVDRVYDYRLDFTNLPEYNPTVSNLRRVGAGALGAGAEYEFDLLMEGAPEPMQTPLRVTIAERPARIVFETGPGYMATEDCSFAAVETGTRVTFAYTLAFPGEIDDATSEMIAAPGRAQARMELENMKKVLEG